MAERPDSTPFLPGFDFPVAIVHGLSDQLVPVERARAVQAAVKTAYLTEVEGAGHMPMMEAPQITARALIFWKAFGNFPFTTGSQTRSMTRDAVHAAHHHGRDVFLRRMDTASGRP